MSLAAMREGLAGRPMPDFGPRLTRDQIALVNVVYDEARNWSAGNRVAKARQ